MGRSSDLLIGLNAGTSAIRAAAFDPAGRELGFATLPNRWLRVDQSGAEQDLAETWQLAARVLRLLADKVPDLARRTTVLAITGQADGTWLIDEDGDPVAPAMLWLDRRAAPLVDAWRVAGVAGAVERITGTALCPALQSAQIAWLLRHRREVLEPAAHILSAKDWLYHCCTGARATDPAQAVRAFGDLRTGLSDRRVLELLGIEEAGRLLPDVVGGSREWHPLSPRAAAATRLWEGTPVVLGPPEPLAAALGTGVVAPDRDVACTVFGSADVHARAHAAIDACAVPPEPGAATMPLPMPGTWIRLRASLGTATVNEWLLGLAEELIADAGLIGLSRADLVALLERKAAQATPGRTLFHPARPWAGEHAESGTLSGAGPHGGLGEMVRAVYDGMALEVLACHAMLGGPPDELRIAGRGCASPTFRRILAAAMGRSVRTVQRGDPATAGAALVAAVALGHHGDASDATATWVAPWLGAPEPIDDQLRATYAALFATYAAARARTASVRPDRAEPA